MPALVPPSVHEALSKGTEKVYERFSAAMKELQPEATDTELDWALQRSRDFNEIFLAYFREGDISVLLPQIKEACRVVAESGFRLDQFASVLLDGSAIRRMMLIEHMPAQPEALARVINATDHFQETVFNEFLRAETEYWRRREREASRFHTDFFANTPFPAMTGGPDLTIQEVNPALPEFLGQRREDAVGRHLRDWLIDIGSDPESADRLLRRIDTQEKLVQTEHHIRCPRQGVEHYLLVSGGFVRSVEGVRLGFQAMFEDVTERRRLMRELSEQKARMDAVFDSSHNGLIFVDSNRVIERINRRACEILGYPPPEEVYAADMSEFRRSVKSNYKDPEGFTRLLNEVYGDPLSSRVGVMELVNPSRNVEYRVGPVYDVEGRPIGWRWRFVDVTERLAAQKLRNDLTNMIVHDLKNPLTSIQGGAQVLRHLAAKDDPRLAQSLDIVQRNCDRMMTMIMNLLDIERLEAGKLPLNRTVFALAPFLESVFVTQRPMGEQRRFAVEVDEAMRDGHDIRIRADRDLLERLLINLVGNAIKHTRPDGRIAIHAERDGENGLRLSVEDNGEGIAAEYHALIFEKFGQAKLRGSGLKTDTGLGLNFCKLAAEAHGGKIFVRSELGNGSSFIVRLPGAVVPAEAAAAVASSAK